MNIEKALEKLKTFNFEYVIVGFKDSGKRCIPADYEMDVVVANDDNIYIELSKFECFKVLNIHERDKTPTQWKDEMIKYANNVMELSERKLLEELKKKYE
jgi:hypothetical protein